MSRVKTFLSVLLAGLVISSPVRAYEQTQLQTFAACAGRLSAVMEYQWMFDGEASERTALQRAAVLDLVDAIMEPDMGRDVLHWRLSAKQAQFVLLTRGTFNEDAQDAAWAMAEAKRYERACTGLLLS